MWWQSRPEFIIFEYKMFSNKLIYFSLILILFGQFRQFKSSSTYLGLKSRFVIIALSLMNDDLYALIQLSNKSTHDKIHFYYGRWNEWFVYRCKLDEAQKEATPAAFYWPDTFPLKPKESPENEKATGLWASNSREAIIRVVTIEEQRTL